jgi:hypothetical protein
MIKYEITIINHLNNMMQVRYIKPVESEEEIDYSIPNETDFYANFSLPNSFTETDCHDIAREGGRLAIEYWEGVEIAEASVFELVNSFGDAKPTIFEEPPEYDDGIQVLIEELVEEEDTYRRTFRVRDLEPEEIIALVRSKRDQLLAATDTEALSDRNPSPEILEYRQALRDITDQPNFPYDLEWPLKPADQ